MAGRGYAKKRCSSQTLAHMHMHTLTQHAHTHIGLSFDSVYLNACVYLHNMCVCARNRAGDEIWLQRMVEGGGLVCLGKWVEEETVRQDLLEKLMKVL